MYSVKLSTKNIFYSSIFTVLSPQEDNIHFSQIILPGNFVHDVKPEVIILQLKDLILTHSFHLNLIIFYSCTVIDHYLKISIERKKRNDKKISFDCRAIIINFYHVIVSISSEKAIKNIDNSSKANYEDTTHPDSFFTCPLFLHKKRNIY